MSFLRERARRAGYTSAALRGLRNILRSYRPWLGVLLCAFLIPMASCGRGDSGTKPGQGEGPFREQSGGAVQFVGSEACEECHLGPYAWWFDSHHQRAMQVADDSTVLGDFLDATFTHFDVTSRFFRKDGRFLIHTEGPDGTMQDFEIRYTFGVQPLQQYLVEFPGGRLQTLGIAWDTEQERWFHIYPEERLSHDDPLHWTGRYQTWNAMCAECHSTDLRKRYDPKRDEYRTTWAEISVGCEACHGSGAPHVEWAHAVEEDPALRSTDPRLPVRFGEADARRELEVCAPCHSRRRRVSGEDEPGGPFLDYFMLETLREGLYHADGQILEEVYVYGSFLQSRMYLWGVRCTDCHDPHSLSLRARGNALCLQCHGTEPPPQFPTLPRREYDTPAHHFHEPGGAGSGCVECHMPVRTYMVVDPRYDHSLRVPRPDLTLKLDTPNACNDCHTDRSARWATDVVAQWYGPERQRGPHYGEVIAAGRDRSPEFESQVRELLADTAQPAIARATASQLLRWYAPEATAAVAEATKTEEPLLRATAIGTLERLPPDQRLAAVASLLEDPIRAVRVEAARVLASVPPNLFDPTQWRAFEGALTEYRDAQKAQSDLPAGRLNLAVLHDHLDEPALAEREYRTALRFDAGFLPASFNLANLYNRLGRNADAETVLLEALSRAPDEGELHYSLGLLLAEERRLGQAAEYLGRATELLPDRARPRYNLALLLQRLGRNPEAEAALLEAHELDARDPDILYALAVFYAQQENWVRALPYAEGLTKLTPEAPGPQQLLQQIREEIPSERDSG